MAEIKSTLDIIMEKTKGMTLSDKEKADLKRKDLEGKIRGLLTRYLDRVIDRTAFLNAYSAIGADDVETRTTVVLESILERIDPGGDSDILLDVAGAVDPSSASAIRKEIDRFNTAFTAFKSGLAFELLAALARKGISGSAVIPPVEEDIRFREWLSREHTHFAARLRASLPPAG